MANRTKIEATVKYEENIETIEKNKKTKIWVQICKI
jgi:hypothetical protein